VFIHFIIEMIGGVFIILFIKSEI